MARAKEPKKGPGRLIARLMKIGLIVFVVIPVAWVLILRVAPVPATFLMLQRAAQGHSMDYRWRPLAKISPAMVNAAIASEDARFCTHHGFDMAALQKAIERNSGGNSGGGGSSISQQTAKNVFLWPQRSWIRKGLETYFTVLIETLWGKRRIMEVYLNVAEMGPGVYGAEAAAREYYDKSALDLTPTQAARIIAILPSPLRYKAVNPGPYVQRRSRAVGGNAATVRNEGLNSCVLK